VPAQPPTGGTASRVITIVEMRRFIIRCSAVGRGGGGPSVL
jgi:hypothetical protein